MKVTRYISLILIPCFSVFLGHNLIPHHHHTEQLSVPLSSDCPIEHGDKHEHEHDAEENPLHCHAFNDVVFNKYRSLQIPSVSEEIINLLIPLSLQVTQAVESGLTCPNIQIKIPDKASEYFGARSLRAPPIRV